MVVTLAAADFANYVDVGEEIHFDAALASALAGFAASSAYVAGEAPGFVAALAGFGEHGVDVADLAEDSGVGCWIGTRRAADGRLVDADDFIDVLGAG